MIRKIQREINPLIIARYISSFISDKLRHQQISLYEAYLLHWEELAFRRIGYTEPGWSGRAGISTCISILNQKYLSHIFQDPAGINTFSHWGHEAYRLNRERRSHYIMNNFIALLDGFQSKELLNELRVVRKNYNGLNFDDGPFHNEEFPYEYYSPEVILLEDENYNDNANKIIRDEVEDIIVELSLRRIELHH